MKLDNRDKLVTWFCQNYKSYVDDMKNCSHFPEHRTNHPFHGEGSVWTHTMMVMTHIHCDMELNVPDKQVLLTVALLHDVGKPASRQTKPLGEDDHKFSFEGHEGLSTYTAIDILNSMEKEDNFYSNSTRKLILELISLHGTSILYEEDTLEYKLQHRFRLADKGGAIRNVDEDIFKQYPKRKVSNRRNVQDDKVLWLMVGMPGSGKTKYIEDNFDDTHYIISRDRYMDTFYYKRNPDSFGTETHNEIYAWINEEDNIVEFNAEFDLYINNAAKIHNKVVVDMTMLTAGKRRNILNRFSKFKANCVCILAGNKLINDVNDIRDTQDCGIPVERLKTLKKKLLIPIKEEGFERVIKILRNE